MPSRLTRRRLLKALGSTATAFSASAQLSASTYSFWVFGLLQPSELLVTGWNRSRVHCHSASGERILEAGQTLAIDSAAVPVRIAGPAGASIHFILEAPMLLRRMYCGTLEIRRPESGILIPVVTMDLETAVNSIVAAELPLLNTGREALAAQAVVARSFMAGTPTPRHNQAFFCDTTHCQFLRSPACDGSPAACATAATKGIVLASDKAAIFPARYSAACGGSTEAGERDGYLYESVQCLACRESGARRRGHGWGLCQEGAIELARRDRSWRAIVRTYFPNATLRAL